MGIATAVENRYIAQQVRAYQKGDKGAYGKLYSLTKDIVFGYIFPQIRNRDMAEDIVMDTYTAGMEKLKDLRDPNAFNKWITEIARTKLIDYTREEKRTHGGEAVAADYAIARESEKADGIVDPFADYAIELKTDLGRVVSGLEREYFAVVYLRYTCGLSISAISELEQIPDRWIPIIDYVDEVWTPSEFIAGAMRKATDKPVTVIPYGMETPYDETLTRADFGLSDDDFLVLTMYDSNSYASRKNPGAAIDAFREAYGDNPEKVKLVIKISNPKPEDLEFVEKKLVPGSYILMTDRLERKQLNSLIRLCDVFLSLHRSEGFGLVMAEAMNLGTAAVATHWSANAEFMPDGTACNVSSRQIPVGDAYQDAPEGLTWADADVHEAAGYLRRLKEDPAYREEITRAGQAYIREKLSTIKCAAKIGKRLDEIILN